MKHNCETLCDDNGIEVLVGYKYYPSDEPGLNETELQSVEIVIGGIGINVLPVMNEKQKQNIISNLQYE